MPSLYGSMGEAEISLFHGLSAGNNCRFSASTLVAVQLTDTGGSSFFVFSSSLHDVMEITNQKKNRISSRLKTKLAAAALFVGRDLE